MNTEQNAFECQKSSKPAGTAWQCLLVPRVGGSLLARIAIAFILVLSADLSAQAQIVYMTSDFREPWGDNDNINAMNTVFGTSGWTEDYFETVNPASLFSASNQFIYIDGSDVDANALSTFLASNTAAMENWVSNGGSLFINAAPNQGGNIDFGFGITLTYNPPSTLSTTATAVDPTNPIFAGPFGATGTTFTGNFFSHATVTGGELDPILTGTAGTVLADETYGSGHIYAGGMTLPTFHSPEPAATELLENILSSGDNAAEAPEPTTWSAMLAGLALLALLRFPKLRLQPRL